MLQVPDTELDSALAEANPWWQPGRPLPFESFKPRAYLPSFLGLVKAHEVRRAVLLLGQRRIGKTVMVHHAIRDLLAEGVPGDNILYCSTDNPAFINLPLSKLVRQFERRAHRQAAGPLYVFLDEIQYLKEWERHLKTLVDSKQGIRFVATGSAAAALRHKSLESGAGRITEFYLPPLTFAEYLSFTDQLDGLLQANEQPDMATMNRAFIDWLNHGGFPEALFSQPVRERPSRFIKQDILDKVLLRDLPSLYGIGDVQELHRFFALLAYNTGQEVSLEQLAKNANINKATLSKYMEYLEAAFLIHRAYRVDQDGRHFKRVTRFKVYLTNPSLRAALYAPLRDDSRDLGALVETGVALHLRPMTPFANSLHYARWQKAGEVDFVGRALDQPETFYALEVKWSDSALDSRDRLKPLVHFVQGKPRFNSLVQP